MDNGTCADCGVATCGKTNREYYMVKPFIWWQAVRKAHAQYLCIGCLESRIGRVLTAKDFWNVPLNHQMETSHRASARLRERLAGFSSRPENSTLSPEDDGPKPGELWDNYSLPF